MTYLKCGTHGRQKQTYVCKHIIETLEDGEPRGFYWDYSENAHEAICKACNDLDEVAFQKAMTDTMRELCYGCFREAAAMNGVILE